MPFTIEIGGQPFTETIMGWIAQGPFVFALNIFLNGGWIFVFAFSNSFNTFALLFNNL